MSRYHELKEEITELRIRVDRLELYQNLYLKPSSVRRLGERMRKYMDAKIEETMNDRIEIRVKEEEEDGK